MATVTKNSDELVIAFEDGVELRMPLRHGCVQGVRDVTVGGIHLRGGDLTWCPIVTTPQGIHFTRFQLDDVVVEGEMVRVVVAAEGVSRLLQEAHDEYHHELIYTRRCDEPIRAQLTWCFEPSACTLDGRDFVGFAYHYEYACDHADGRLNRLFDDATWEIDGQVDGNSLLLQAQVSPPVTELATDGYFTTSCAYYGAEMRGSLGPGERISIGRLPRIGVLQPFDFLAHDKGILFAEFEPMVDVFSIIHSDAGDPRLHVIDEYRGPLANTFRSPTKHVRFHQTVNRSRAVVRNCWKAAFDRTAERARTRAGVAASPVLPRVWVPQNRSFGGRPDDDRYLYDLADHTLPVWADMGVREICMPPLWRSDFTAMRHMRKSDTGMHGQLTVSGICAVHEHVVDDYYGGLEALAYFVDRAHQFGMQVQLWWATHLSGNSSILKAHPEYALKTRELVPDSGGYVGVIISLDLNIPEVSDLLFNELKTVYDATGVDGLFHDSYGNMTFLPSNFAHPERLGQQQAYERLVVRLQSAGIKTFTIEGLGPFGVGHFGMNLLSPEVGRYQNALDWWLGQEDMCCGLNMGIGAPVWDDDVAAKDFSFRCIAGGGRFGFTTTAQGVEHWDGWLREHNRLMNEIGPLTGRRVMLADGAGVRWEREDGSEVLFVFADKTLDRGERAMWQVRGDGRQAVAASSVEATAYSVFILEPQPAEAVV